MPTCFVVMGFGKKTDYPTGRVLDLDKSYRYIIKPAAESAGYECVRADEIQHAGNINVPMYQQLLNADVVVADVSTYNPNAFYELGVRHALKPYTTITIAESKLVFPFDVGQIAIRTYQHLGEGIDYGEVERMKKELAEAIRVVGKKATCDSPVYTFLQNLRPPVLAIEEARRVFAGAVADEGTSQPTIRTLMDQAESALEKSEFLTAKSLFAVVRSMKPMESYVVQRLVLATYKSKLPSAEAALREAGAILETLSPATSTDAETLGLYGAVHKGLWEATGSAADLEKAIWAYEKGFYVKDDSYNGINLAFLLNVRCAERAESEKAEAIADFVLAQRIRRRVVALCQPALSSTAVLQGPDRYWMEATAAEAMLGLGDEGPGQVLLREAKARGIAAWMLSSTETQLGKLRDLLTRSPLGRIS